MKHIFIIIGVLTLTSFLLSNECIAQNKKPINFTYHFLNKNDSDDIKLIVENVSSKTLYYSIALQGYNDTTWIPLLSDINSLGLNEFLALKRIAPGKKAIKYVSKKRIFLLYKFANIRRIRFGLMYYEKQNLDSKGQIIYLPM